MIKKILSTIYIVAIGVVLATSISYAANIWQGPAVSQEIINGIPSGNALRPINIGGANASQNMFGILYVGTTSPVSAGGVLGTNFLNVFGSAVISQNLKGDDGKTYMDNFINTTLRLGVDGDVGANRYCDTTGTNCIVLSDTDAGSGATVSGNIVASRICLAGDCRSVWDLPPAGGGIGFFGVSNMALTIWGQTACILGFDHSVYCSGYNGYGQLGVGDTTSRTTFTSVTSLGNSVSKLVGSTNTLCALTTDATNNVKCWGYNGQGQVGDGTTANKTVPVTVSGLQGLTITDIQANTGWYNDANGNHFPTFTCALTDSGSVYCWGYNGHGELGNGNTTSQSSAVQVYPPSPSTPGTPKAVAIKLAGGNGGYACMILSDKTVKCWGYNAYGQLGVGDTTNRTVPTTVPGLSNVVDIQLAASNYGHTCALTGDGAVYCWGNNAYGQIYYTGSGNATTPVRMGISLSIAALWKPYVAKQIAVAGGGSTTGTANSGYTCIVVGAGDPYYNEGNVLCWGFNGQGNLGNGTTVSSNAVGNNYPVYPVATTAGRLTDVKKVIVANGAYQSTCALTNTGTVYCWGNNSVGQLGVGDTTDRSYATQVAGLTGVKDLFMSGSSSNVDVCGIMSDNTIKCWGYNGNGELGTGNKNSSKTPLSPI